MASVTESEWDDESRDWVVALSIVQRNTGEYGEWLPDATSDAAAPNDYSSGFRYVGEGPFTNWARKAAMDTQDAHKKAAGDDANLNGVFFTARRIEFDPVRADT